MKKPMYWGYLHSNRTIQVKPWFGDHLDYTLDCKDNPFVLQVVEPFEADTKEEATRIIQERLGFIGEANEELRRIDV